MQVSMDGPCVNLKIYKELTNERSDSGIPVLIDSGKCSLHSTIPAFQRGKEQSGRNLKKTLKSARQLFHDSTARREYYKTLTGT